MCEAPASAALLCVVSIPSFFYGSACANHRESLFLDTALDKAVSTVANLAVRLSRRARIEKAPGDHAAELPLVKESV